MSKEAVQQPAGKFGLSRRNFDMGICHLLWSKLRPDLCTTPLHLQPAGGGRVCTHLWSLTLHVKKWMSRKQDEPGNWVKYNSQNYWAYIAIRLFCNTVRVGNWALVLAIHLVWQPLNKFKIVLKRNYYLLPAAEDLDGPWIYSGQKWWLCGTLGLCQTVQY